MKRNVLKKIISGLSFTSAIFIFQACYGTPQDFGMDLLIEGQVKSKSTGKGIEGIKVLMNGGDYYEYTRKDGEFAFYAEPVDSIHLVFQDVDSLENNSYSTKDTLLREFGNEVFVAIELEEK